MNPLLINSPPSPPPFVVKLVSSYTCSFLNIWCVRTFAFLKKQGIGFWLEWLINLWAFARCRSLGKSPGRKIVGPPLESYFNLSPSRLFLSRLFVGEYLGSHSLGLAGSIGGGWDTQKKKDRSFKIMHVLIHIAAPPLLTSATSIYVQSWKKKTKQNKSASGSLGFFSPFRPL